MIAHHRFRLADDGNCAEVDSGGLAEEIDSALASLASDASPRGEARKLHDEFADLCKRHAIPLPVSYFIARLLARFPAHPAPATVEMRELVANLAAVVRAQNGNRHDDINALLAQADAALAPATEGKKNDAGR